jgi:predicted AlkP superfamily pyrophosphatase or phosphodiesterase
MRGFDLIPSISIFKRRHLPLFLVAAIAPLCLSAPNAAAQNNNPKLLVTITIDGLRGDMLPRFKDRFGSGGFKYLMDKGTFYTKAHYQQSNTITAVGHATLFTGGHPSQHGIASNDWFDRKSGKRMYCVGDDSVTMVGSDKAGSSPRNLKSSTIGDQLVLASGQKSRVFSVSIKDRGAVLPGGFKGKAFWYQKNTGDFSTSTYYYKDLPKWVKDWNGAKHADRYKTKPWELMYDQASYVHGDEDDRASETSYGELGRTFPHSMKTEKPATFYKSLRIVPYGDILTVGFAKELMNQEKLGQGSATDMLAVSLSVNDYIGHYFGPESLESEDNLLHLDKTLADFFAHIDKTVGLDKTLIVLAADHGTDDVPEYKHKIGFPAGRHQVKTLIDTVNAGLQARFKTKEEFINTFIEPNMYLKNETVAKLGLDPVEVETALADELLKVDGISMAWTRNDLATGKIPNNSLTRKVQRAFFPERSGDVYIIQDQFWYLSEWGDELAASHGTPYPYDTHVPVLFAGPGIKAQTVNRQIAPVDIVATLAVYLGTNLPSGSVGVPLDEILEGKNQLANK